MLEERPDPQITVSKLGEYLDSSPIRRRRIVADQKHPTEFITGRYHEAVEAMTEYFARGRDDRVIHDAVEALSQKQVASEFEEQDRELSIRALESFLDIVAPLNLSRQRIERGDPDAPPLRVAGVTINVQPEIILIGQDYQGNPTVGAIKFYLSKTHPLSESAADYIGALVFHYVSQYLSDKGRPDHRICYTIDVFAGAVHRAPRAHKRRLTYVRAASEEIARSWSFA